VALYLFCCFLILLFNFACFQQHNVVVLLSLGLMLLPCLMPAPPASLILPMPSLSLPLPPFLPSFYSVEIELTPH
jgi:hypothetical protein